MSDAEGVALDFGVQLFQQVSHSRQLAGAQNSAKGPRFRISAHGTQQPSLFRGFYGSISRHAANGAQKPFPLSRRRHKIRNKMILCGRVALLRP